MDNVIDQWMSLLGLQRQADLAAMLCRGSEAVSRWKKENRIPAASVVTLKLIAQTRGIKVPTRLAQPKTKRPSNGAAA